MFINDWLARRESLTPNKVALVDSLNGDRKISFRQWNRNANRTARFLSEELGIGKGDRVALLAMNSVEYLDTWFALGKIGAVMQNLNWRLAVPELTRLLEDARPRALIYGDDFTSAVRRMRGPLPSIERYVALGAADSPEDIPFGRRDAYSDRPLPEVELSWDDPWVICYTGGTTGVPKGALLTYRSITANSVNTIVSWGLTPEDMTILDAPLFHTGGLNVFTAPLVHIGGTSIICRAFDPDQTFDLIRQYPVSVYFGVPTVFLMLQQHPRWESADFSKLKLVISGGAPCPMPIFETFWERDVDFKTGYGLTEAGPNTFWLPPEDVRRKPGSVGFPLFHVDVGIVREDETPCDPEEIGQLVIRGPHLCRGYWNNPEATAEAIRPLASDPEGPEWLRTGDLARRDSEGYHYIVGRSKDMFISGGENVYPAEIESVLHLHPAVAECAVIGVPHGKWGEVGKAILVLKPGKDLTQEELFDFAREHLAGYKVPKSLTIVKELPKTGANKVDRKLLVDGYG
jgi:fatty-acyl-CoA synthase